jgi:hypothetical protein
LRFALLRFPNHLLILHDHEFDVLTFWILNVRWPCPLARNRN